MTIESPEKTNCTSRDSKHDNKNFPSQVIELQTLQILRLLNITDNTYSTDTNI